MNSDVLLLKVVLVPGKYYCILQHVVRNPSFRRVTDVCNYSKSVTRYSVTWLLVTLQGSSYYLLFSYFTKKRYELTVVVSTYVQVLVFHYKYNICHFERVRTRSTRCRM